MQRVPTPRVVAAYKTFCAIFEISLNVITTKYTNTLRNSANNIDLSPRSREKSQVISHSTSKIISAYNSTLCDFYEIILKVPSPLHSTPLSLRNFANNIDLSPRSREKGQVIFWISSSRIFSLSLSPLFSFLSFLSSLSYLLSSLPPFSFIGPRCRNSFNCL
jgi:hypothetical protein